MCALCMYHPRDIPIFVGKISFIQKGRGSPTPLQQLLAAFHQPPLHDNAWGGYVENREHPAPTSDMVQMILAERRWTSIVGGQASNICNCSHADGTRTYIHLDNDGCGESIDQCQVRMIAANRELADKSLSHFKQMITCYYGGFLKGGTPKSSKSLDHLVLNPMVLEIPCLKNPSCGDLTVLGCTTMHYSTGWCPRSKSWFIKAIN